MSEETGQTAEEKKSREAAEEASALDKLTDRVSRSASKIVMQHSDPSYFL